jgi:signal transduction histidine kinase
LGSVQLSNVGENDDLDNLDRQAQLVVNRFQKIMTQLDDARRDANRNERLAAIGHMAAGVAHEIRNPLTAVKLLVQSAGQKAASGSWNAGQMAVIREEIGRIEHTIQDLLDFAKPATYQHMHHDLCETLRRAVRLLQGRAAQNDMHIDVINDGSPEFVNGDPEQLHQVFVNLFMNGMDAMSPGGRLKVEVRRLAQGAASSGSNNGVSENGVASGEVSGEVCQIVVSDDGAGIPTDLIDHIFEPFVTSKARGTGLGLAISRRIVEAHGGRLTVANRTTGGAEFVMQLPIATHEPAKSETHAEAAIR